MPTISDEHRAALRRWVTGPVTSVERITTGTMNDTFLIRTAGGPFVLRRHRTEDRAAVEHEHDLTAHARAGGIPAPPVRTTRDGERTARVGAAWYSVYEHATGYQVGRAGLRPAHAAAMGAALARIHDVVADATPVRLPPEARAEPPDAATTLTRLRELRALVRDVPDPVESDRWAADRLDSRIGWLERHPRLPAVPRLADLPGRQTIHGDYQESNVFFDGPDPGGTEPLAVSAVIDWDKSEHEAVAFEIARTLYLAFDLEPVRCRAFVSAYRARRPLPATELDAGAAAYTGKQLHDTWVLDTVYRQGDDRPRRFIGPGPYVPPHERWGRVRAEL